MEEPLQGMAQFLVRHQFLSKDDVLRAQRSANSSRMRLLPYLSAHHLISAQSVAQFISKRLDLPFFDLDHWTPEHRVYDVLSEELIQRYQVLPILHEQQLQLAMDDPIDSTVQKEIQFYTGLSLQPLVVESDKLQQLIESTHPQTHDSTDDDAAIHFVDRILEEALRKNASDVHFEPYEEAFRIRYRLDGVLHEIANHPLDFFQRIAARLKIMAHLDISERRLPQDGHFKMKHHHTDVRISTCPTCYGEKIVVRLLKSRMTQWGIEYLGFSESQQQIFLRAIHRPQGLILVTGPTGSGKTMTLYTALHHINTIDKNISTVEDPVEIHLPGINQVQIHPKIGLTFSKTLRAFLRQDPDIILIGEIRDSETAEIAIKAAQTGHLVLATLHTHDAKSALKRLTSMGASESQCMDCIPLIISQRLLRRLCEHCKTLEKPNHYKAIGCSSCTAGYNGRFGVFEMFQPTLEPGKNLYRTALEKVHAGWTTLEEINRVVMDDETH